MRFFAARSRSELGSGARRRWRYERPDRPMQYSFDVFTRFITGTPVGDAAVATWAQWARRLVTDAGDLRLAERFTDLSERLPTSASPLDTITAEPDELLRIDGKAPEQVATSSRPDATQAR